MRHFLPVLSLAVLLLSLAACRKQVDPAQMAAVAAKGYYDLLLEGNYEAYVDGFHYPDSIPASYRRQLLDNARMFIANQREAHKGIKRVEVTTAKADTATRSANVFLQGRHGHPFRQRLPALCLWRQREGASLGAHGGEPRAMEDEVEVSSGKTR